MADCESLLSGNGIHESAIVLSLQVRNSRLDAALEKSPLQQVFRRRSRQRLTVLAFHDVLDGPWFRLLMQDLCDRNNPVDLALVVRWSQGLAELPDRAVLVTFDDGDISVLRCGFPVLRDLHIPAVLFVVTDLIGTDNPYWWDEAGDLLDWGGSTAIVDADSPASLVSGLKRVPNQKRIDALEELRSSAQAPARRQTQLSVRDLNLLQENGVVIGNHSCSHPCMNQCSDEEIAREVALSHQCLEEWLGTKPQAFAYPNGNFDRRVVEKVRESGYETAFQFDHALNRPGEPEDPLLLSRVRVNSNASLARFRIILSGLHPALHRARGRH